MLGDGNHSPKINIIIEGLRVSWPTNLQPFGEIGDFETRGFVELSQVNEEFMGNPAIFILIAQAVMTLKARCHIIRIKKSDLGRFDQSVSSKHFDVRPGDQGDRCTSERCG